MLWICQLVGWQIVKIYNFSQMTSREWEEKTERKVSEFPDNHHEMLSEMLQLWSVWRAQYLSDPSLPLRVLLLIFPPDDECDVAWPCLVCTSQSSGTTNCLVMGWVMKGFTQKAWGFDHYTIIILITTQFIPFFKLIFIKSRPKMLTSGCIVFVSQAPDTSCEWGWLIIKTHQKSQNAICTLPFKILQSVSTVTRDTFFGAKILVEAAKIFWGKLFLIIFIFLKEEQWILNSFHGSHGSKYKRRTGLKIPGPVICVFIKLYGTLS